jgi:3-oxoadipate enol-lactonase
MTLHVIQGVAVEESGSGPAVVCVHGLGGTSNTWSAMQSAFEGFRWVRVDLPGCGRSEVDVNNIRVEDMVACLQKACQHLGITQAHWIAHSMGTIVCQQLALAHPALVKSLVLFGPLISPADAAKEGLRKRALDIQQESLAGMQAVADQLLVTAVSGHTKANHPAAYAFVRESLMRQTPKAYADYCLALANVQAASVEQIQAPSLLVTGDEDKVAAPDAVRAMSRRMHQSRCVVLNRCGHWTPIEKPHECVRETREFLKRHA